MLKSFSASSIISVISGSASVDLSSSHGYSHTCFFTYLVILVLDIVDIILTLDDFVFEICLNHQINYRLLLLRFFV